jgi:hypothetical protein
MAMDQLWLNYLPIYFNNVSVIQQVAWHFGLHSVIGSTLKFHNEEYVVNDAPLISVEFAGIVDYHPIWSDHNRLTTNDKDWINLKSLYLEQCDTYEKLCSFIGVSYGKKVRVKSYRNIRKKVVKVLSFIISSIKHFDLTHN